MMLQQQQQQQQQQMNNTLARRRQQVIIQLLNGQKYNALFSAIVFLLGTLVNKDKS